MSAKNPPAWMQIRESELNQNAMMLLVMAEAGMYSEDEFRTKLMLLISEALEDMELTVASKLLEALALPDEVLKKRADWLKGFSEPQEDGHEANNVVDGPWGPKEK